MFNNDLRNKLYSYAINKLGLREYRRGWLKGLCPDCGRPDKYGFNISKNRTNCFVCGYHPSPLTMVMETEGLDNYQEAKKFLRLYEGKQYLEPVIERIERIETVLPDSFKSLLIGDGLFGNNARKYIISRGFDPEEMAYKGWGYCSSGSHMGYIIIPFYVGGKLTYYNARRYLGSGPKYMNPTIEDFGIGKSLIMYNSDALAMYDEVFLAEGAINAETIGDQGIATGGKKIAKYQISMILKSEVDKVTLLLDPDAIDDSIKVAMELSYHKQTRVIRLPDETDINDLGYERTMEEINKTPFMSYNQLLKLKHET